MAPLNVSLKIKERLLTDINLILHWQAGDTLERTIIQLIEYNFNQSLSHPTDSSAIKKQMVFMTNEKNFKLRKLLN